MSVSGWLHVGAAQSTSLIQAGPSKSLSGSLEAAALPGRPGAGITLPSKRPMPRATPDSLERNWSWVCHLTPQPSGRSQGHPSAMRKSLGHGWSEDDAGVPGILSAPSLEPELEFGPKSSVN
jgi:hypothetical protein